MVYSAKTSPVESPPVIKSTPLVLRERPKRTQPSPPIELVKLRQIVGVLQMFSACISSGMGILEFCKVAGSDTGFNDQVGKRRSMLNSLAS